MHNLLQVLGEFFVFALSAIFIENAIFSRALGASRALALAKRRRHIGIYGALLTVITTTASFISWAINQISIYIFQITMLEPLIFITSIGIVYLIAYILIRHLCPKLFESIGYYLPIATFNCAVMGGVLLAVHQDFSLVQTLGFGFGTGIGFTLATLLILDGLDKLEGKKIPQAFKGLPLMLVYIGILSLAIYGLIGHQLPF